MGDDAGWRDFLAAILEDYRTRNPEDKRDTKTILTSLMDFYVKEGLIKKGKNGKYLLPTILLD